MPARTVLKDQDGEDAVVPEKCTSEYRGVLKDQTGAVVPGSALTTLTLTLHDEGSGAIINGVNGVDVKNTGRGTVDSAGNFIITFDPADNPVLDQNLGFETHIVTLQFTWSGGNKAGRHEGEFKVRNFTKVS